MLERRIQVQAFTRGVPVVGYRVVTARVTGAIAKRNRVCVRVYTCEHHARSPVAMKKECATLAVSSHIDRV